MTFLPEEDCDELASKGISYREEEEKLPDGTVRRGVMFPGFGFQGNLFESQSPCTHCELLVLIPSGYAKTKLDSFYTRPHLKRQNGAFPDRANVIQKLFGADWQFWSRHLSDQEWEKSGRDLLTYLHIVRDALRQA